MIVGIPVRGKSTPYGICYAHLENGYRRLSSEVHCANTTISTKICQFLSYEIFQTWMETCKKYLGEKKKVFSTI
jgi:hypothetical protein